MTTTSRTGQSKAPARGDMIPDFTAQTPSGETVRSRDFYMRRNLALVFTHHPECPRCRQLLTELGAQQQAIQAEAGATVAIVPGEVAEVRDLVSELDLPYPVMVDPAGEIHQRYGIVQPGGKPGAAIIVTDRYGTVFEASVADADHAMMSAEEVPGWLEFVACRCS